MRIKSIAPWFGGKRTMAPMIVEELGPHAAYWEPFCGSMAVLFQKPISGHEHLSDLYGDVISLARVVRSELGPRLFERLTRTLYSEQAFFEIREMWLSGHLPPVDSTVGWAHLERAYQFFIVSWMGRNGVSGSARANYQMAVRWTPGGGGSAGRFISAVDSMPAWANRLRHVTILQRDAFEVLEKIEDDPRAAIYIDPPYFVETRGKGGGSRYEHDFDDADHRRLAESLSRFEKARVVISYYAHPRLADLYPLGSWTHRNVFRNKNLHVQNRRGEKPSTAPEVLILNGPSYVRSQTPTLFAGASA